MAWEDIIRKVGAGERITPAEAFVLYERAPLAALGGAACEIRERIGGNALWYNRNFHIEPTNVCTVGCAFCSYHRREGDPGAWDYSLDEVEAIARRYAGSAVTEVHIVGGVHPRHDFAHYEELIRRVKAALPGVVVKAFTAVELTMMIRGAGLSLAEGLERLQAAGLEAIAGGGAEIFDAEVRGRICPSKIGADEWLELHRQAHRLGISSNATMLYGHLETPAQRIDHLDRLRSLQDETGGFNAFIPLKFRSAGNALAHLGEVSAVEDMRTLALSRIFLDNIPHLKAYWPMYGKAVAEMALAFGADDMDGTIDDTTRIYSLAGAEEQSPVLTIGEIERMAASAGLVATERDTFYHEVKEKTV